MAKVLSQFKRYINALDKCAEESEYILGNLYMDYEDQNNFYYNDLLKIIALMIEQQEQFNNIMEQRLVVLSDVVKNSDINRAKKLLTKKISTTRELKL